MASLLKSVIITTTTLQQLVKTELNISQIVTYHQFTKICKISQVLPKDSQLVLPT